MTRPQLAKLLAMPPTLRHLVLQAALTRSSLSPRSMSSAGGASEDLAEPPIPISYLPTPSNIPDQRANPSPPPTASVLEAATEIFTKQRPKFMYAAPRFLHIPINSHMPEVCILGRSNVGKSTLINALSGRSSASAGKIHGNASKRAGLAMTSTKAGCTTTMNAYGFGLPMKTLPPSRREEGDEKGSGLGVGRTEKRAEKKRRERPPAHSLVMMDMPGYGLNSKTAWGVEIAKYLGRRAMLRGAILLIDAVAGVKDGDRAVLGLLRDANVRTAVVLTKADKLGYGLGSGDADIQKTCLSVWKELRAAEKGSLTWVEGKGWEPEVWITGAGDPKHGGIGVEGARLAICRMAGLVQDTRDLSFGAVTPSSGKIVSFDELFARMSSSPQQRPPPSF
ncbi:hypothetical protein GQ53DRAFT_743941 [Thozetella sp. PMI_491]|nr:hypothetical protein GQ53DRAFT_743941 [Thozetella sp. PMI_491]